MLAREDLRERVEQATGGPRSIFSPVGEEDTWMSNSRTADHRAAILVESRERQ
jgi:hypothetical protein